MFYKHSGVTCWPPRQVGVSAIRHKAQFGYTPPWVNEKEGWKE